MCKTFMIEAMKPVSLLFDQPTYIAVNAYGLEICYIIIYQENCSIQIALVKTSNRFPYCTESMKVLSYCTGLRNILSYCTGLRKGVSDRTTLPGGRHEGRKWQPFFFANLTEEMANLQKK